MSLVLMSMSNCAKIVLPIENISVTSQGQITFRLIKNKSNKKEGEGGGVKGSRSKGGYKRAPSLSSLADTRPRLVFCSFVEMSRVLKAASIISPKGTGI